MKIPCTVVKDLLPLYHDNVCSPETAALVEEHLRECESCQEEFHRLEEAPLPPASPEKEEKKAEGLKKIQRTLHRRWVKVVAVAAVAVVILGFVGNIVLQMPLLNQPVESIKSVSVDEKTERLTVNISAPGGVSGFREPVTEGSNTNGTILVLSCPEILSIRIQQLISNGWEKNMNYPAYDYAFPLTMESELRYGNAPWVEEVEELDPESLQERKAELENIYPGGDVTKVYYYEGPGMKYTDREYVLSHLEDQCTLLWTAEDGVVYQPLTE